MRAPLTHAIPALAFDSLPYLNESKKISCTFLRERAYKSLNWWIRIKTCTAEGRSIQSIVNGEIVLKSRHTAGTRGRAPPGASGTAPRTVTSRFNRRIMFVSDCYDVLWGTFSSRHLSHLFSCFSAHRCVHLVFTPCSHLRQTAAAFLGTSAFSNVDRVSREQTKIKIASSHF